MNLGKMTRVIVKLSEKILFSTFVCKMDFEPSSLKNVQFKQHHFHQTCFRQHTFFPQIYRPPPSTPAAEHHTPSSCVPCRVRYVNIPSRRPQHSLELCVGLCTCVLCECSQQHYVRGMTMVTQGGQWTGGSARLFTQPGGTTTKPILRVHLFSRDIRYTHYTKATSGPEVTVRKEACWEEECGCSVEPTPRFPQSPPFCWRLSDALSFGTHYKAAIIPTFARITCKTNLLLRN